MTKPHGPQRRPGAAPPGTPVATARAGRRLLVLALGAALATACGGAGARDGARSAHDVDLPPRLDDASVPAALRAFHSLPIDDPRREDVRARLLGWYDGRTAPLLADDDYDAVVAHLEDMAALYTPLEIGEGRVDETLRPPARYVADRGAARSDEARVLGALRLLLAIGETPDPAIEAEHRDIVAWGLAARATVGSDIDQQRRLAEVYEAYADLAPAPEVLEKLRDVYLDLRGALVALIRSGPEAAVREGRASFRDLRVAPALIRSTVLALPAVYLRQGDVAQAEATLASVGDLAGPEQQLARVLGDARRGGAEGAEALLELAELFREERPEVARGLCRRGRQERPEDDRFPLCLARVATLEEDHLDATAWYAEAIRLAPERRRIYDEALESLAELIARGLFDPDPSVARGIAAEAQQILAARQARFPDTEPAVSPSRLEYAVGLLEMNAGDTVAARRHLEASLGAEESPQALLQLGILEERTGHPEAAARHFLRALELTPDEGLDARLARGELLERLGDAFREAGNDTRSRRMYEDALATWDAALGTELPERGRAFVELRRGVLRDRLGEPRESRSSFEVALDLAPESQDTYARILSHLVVGTPDLPFAERVFRQAQRQLTLEPEWKVYFALWVSAVAARQGQAPGEDVRRTLTELAGADAWFGRLAKFGLGQLPYAELLDEASGLGETTEAHFYEGARLLGTGDQDGARRLFERVIETNMVQFYEFAMAKELLR